MKGIKSTLSLETSFVAELLPRLQRAHPRAGALLAASWADDSLKEFLLSRLIDDKTGNKALFEPRGSFGDFGSRIKVAFALGLIGADLRDDLDSIRVLRNGFAHVRDPLSFADKRVSARCHAFNTVKVFNRFAVKPIRGAKEGYLATTLLITQFLLSLARSPARPDRRLIGLYGVTTKGIAESMSLELLMKVLDGIKSAVRGA